MSVTLNLVPVFNALNEAVAPLGVVLGGWLITEACGYLKIKQGSTAQSDLSAALWHGEVLLTHWFASFEDHNKSLTVPDDVLEDVATQVLALAPGAAKHLKATPESIAPLLQARFTQTQNFRPTLGSTGEMTPGATVTNYHFCGQNSGAADQPSSPAPEDTCAKIAQVGVQTNSAQPDSKA